MVVEVKLPQIKFDGIKEHISRNKKTYLFGSYIVVAGITYYIMRGVASQHIQGGNSVLAQGGSPVLGKSVVTNNVSYILSNRQGPPSWVVRCKETGDIFTSQKAAALELGLPSSEISKHLNGLMDGNVRGYTFERICLAA